MAQPGGLTLHFAMHLVTLAFMLTDIAAYPESVNVLNDITSDVRTPDKLIDGVNDTVDGRHMWLAPILPNVVCSRLLLTLVNGVVLYTARPVQCNTDVYEEIIWSVNVED